MRLKLMLAMVTATATPSAIANMAEFPQNMAESGQSAAALPYAITVQRVIQAPLIVDATVRSAARIKGAEAAGLPQGRARFYVEADVVALIRGPRAIAPRVGYLVDVPLDERGRAPKLKGQRVILFARPVTGRADQLALVARDSQIPWAPADDAQIKQVVRDVLAPNAPPQITGIGNAFHVPGTLPGEGETQIFLQTSGGNPVSILVLRRPGEQRRWAVSLGEIVDETAGPPERNTLLWYRLACGLPRTMPPAATANEDPSRAAIAQEDYAFVLRALGPCDRASSDS